MGARLLYSALTSHWMRLPLGVEGYELGKAAFFSQGQLLEKGSAMSHQQVVGMNASVIRGVLEVHLSVHYRHH